MHSKYGKRRKTKASKNVLKNDVPRPLEIMRDKIRTYIDKYAVIKEQQIEYSFYDPKTREASKRTLSLAECTRIVGELYG